jgi:sugar phosphate isomerase/epimerase
MFPAASAEDRKRRLDDNFRAVEECAELQADSLVLVVGAAADVPLQSARAMVADALTALVPYAHSHGVRLGLEPLHPMFAADRCVLNTIDQALAMAAPYSAADVGLILDTYHIWWDPRVFEQIAQAAGRICGFHVSDWPVPLPDILMGRAMMGDGVIDNRLIREAVDCAGYAGPIEVEIFNRAVWDAPGDEVLDRVIERFAAKV